MKGKATTIFVDGLMVRLTGVRKFSSSSGAATAEAPSSGGGDGGGDGGGKKDEPSNVRLYLVCLFCFLSNLSMGFTLGFSAILIPQLQEERQISDADASVIASISNLGQLAAALAAGPISSRFGGRLTAAAFGVVTATGFVGAAVSGGRTDALAAARFAQGFAIVCSVVQVYISDLSPPQQRGFLGASGTAAISAGVSAVYALGAALPWRVTALACAAMPALGAVAFACFCPDSPAWLFLQGREEEARSVTTWLRGRGYDPSEEMKKLEDLNGGTRKGRGGGVSACDKVAFSELRHPSVAKACLLLMALMVMMMASGATVVGFYAVEILQDLAILDNAYVGAVVLSLFRLAGGLLGPSLLRSGVSGKRSILVVTSFAMSASVLGLAAVTRFEGEFGSVVGHFWSSTALPLLFLVVFMFAFGLGPVSIPWTLLGELVPPKIAPLATSLSVSASLLTLYALTQAYPFLLSALTLEGTFCLYAAVSLAMAVVAAAFLPETNRREARDVLREFE